ncbi:hypothetical protein BV898_04366 [Hypsibius exemplaris]|uniref:Uncharacterized protein n=1 Tax=Hypsibius exemplaris TaxID=2072580 RepID=A0A1W0X325_HYPEX|nr:hypothetical protein BV898_04366 [Hypsibius exemplaris]
MSDNRGHDSEASGFASPSPLVDSTATIQTSLSSTGSPPQQHSVSNPYFSLSHPTAARHDNVVAAEFINLLPLLATDGNNAMGSHAGTSTMLFPETLMSEGKEAQFRRKFSVFCRPNLL